MRRCSRRRPGSCAPASEGLQGEFTTSIADNVAHLSYLSFKADSFCPNFLDKDEGDYSVFTSTISGEAESQAQVAIWVGGLPTDVPGDQHQQHRGDA